MRNSNRKSSAPACPTRTASSSSPSLHMRLVVLAAVLLTFLPHAATALAAAAPPSPRVLPFQFQKSGPLGARHRHLPTHVNVGHLAAQNRRQLEIRDDDGLDNDTVHQLLQNKGILYLINVTVGTPPQPMQLQVDTASSDIWVLSKSITPCRDADDYHEPSSCIYGSFDDTKSSTLKLLGKGRFCIVYVDGTRAVGDYVSDTFAVGPAVVQGMQIGLAKDANLSYGVMGVGFEGDQASVSPGGMGKYPSLVSRMVSQGLIKSRAFSLWLDDLASDTGILLFGGIDTARFIGNLTSIPIETARGQPDPLAFAIPLTAVSLSDGKSHFNITSKSLPSIVVLDSGSSLTLLPQPIASSLAAQFSAKFSHQLNLYVIDCNYPTENAFVEYSFSYVVNIRVPMSELILPLTQYSGGATKTTDGSDVCVLGISASNNSYSLFGDTFLRSAYIVYDLDNNRIAMAQTEFDPSGQNVVEIGVGQDSIPFVGVSALKMMATETIDVTSTAQTGAVSKSAASKSAVPEAWNSLLALLLTVLSLLVLA
ncbi:Candidapepsin-8 [Orbilia brochopaga]|nr:Candidapepsin-8 [Drechslerella brochopaga]